MSSRDHTSDWRSRLDHSDTQLARWALRRIAGSVEIEDWEFDTVLGSPRASFADMADEWAAWDDAEELRTAAVAAVGNILGYPGFRVDPEMLAALEGLLAKLLDLAPSPEAESG